MLPKHLIQIKLINLHEEQIVLFLRRDQDTEAEADDGENGTTSLVSRLSSDVWTCGRQGWRWCCSICRSALNRHLPDRLTARLNLSTTDTFWSVDLLATAAGSLFGGPKVPCDEECNRPEGAMRLCFVHLSWPLLLFSSSLSPLSC